MYPQSARLAGQLDADVGSHQLRAVTKSDMMAGRLIVNPLLETAVDAEPALLQCRLAEEGYVFVRGLLNPGLVGEARDLAVGCLEEAGLASGADRPIWSGRAPRENELASDGPLVSAVAEDGVICRLAHSAELVRFLERLIGGEVFVWQDCAGRLRIMLGDHADDAGAAGPLRFSFSTPAHQDFYFFRPVRTLTCWIPLMEIDESVGGLALRRRSHRDGLWATWWKGTEFLGVPATAAQAHEWRRDGAVPVAGTLGPGDEQEGPDGDWLRSDYHPGDALIFAGETLHAGVPNRSEAIRMSADVRYQPADSPLHWEAKQSIARTQSYFGEILSALNELRATPGHFERAWEELRVAGPHAHRGVRERVEQTLTRLRGL